MTWVKTAEVTFSGSSAVNIDGCFSASYTHYMVTRNALGSLVGYQYRARLRASGTDDSGTNYREQRLYGANTTVGGSRATGATYWTWALGFTEGTAVGYGILRISNPFEAVRTTAWSDHSYGVTGSIEINRVVMSHDATTSYTGLTVYPEGGTITGTIRVYGLKES